MESKNSAPSTTTMVDKNKSAAQTATTGFGCEKLQNYPLKPGAKNYRYRLVGSSPISKNRVRRLVNAADIKKIQNVEANFTPSNNNRVSKHHYMLSEASSQSSQANVVNIWLKGHQLELQSRYKLCKILKIKLERAISCTNTAIEPNRFLTAVCCEIFDTFSKVFGRFSDCLNVIRNHLLKSIYISVATMTEGSCDKELRLRNEEARIIRFDDNTSNEIEVVTARGFLKCEPYFARISKYLARKTELEKEISNWGDEQHKLREVILEKQKLLKKMRFRWQKKHLFASFRSWCDFILIKKRKRSVIDGCFARSTQYKVKAIFRAWTEFVKEETKKRAVDRIKELQRKKTRIRDDNIEINKNLKKVQDKIDGFQQSIKEKEKELKKLKVEVVDSQSKLNKEIERESSYKQLANVGMQFCLRNIPEELKVLEAQISKLTRDAKNSVNPKLILPIGISNVESLLHFSVEEVLLLWINRQAKEWIRYSNQENKKLSTTNSASRYPEMTHMAMPATEIKNFGEDMKDGKGFMAILFLVQGLKGDNMEDVVGNKELSFNCTSKQEFYPSALFKNNSDLLKIEENKIRANTVVKMLKKIGFSNKRFTKETIIMGVEDLNLVAMSYLFCNFPSLHATPEVDPCKQSRIAFNQATSVYNLLKEETNFDPSLVFKAQTKLEEARRQVKWATSAQNKSASIWEKLKHKVKVAAWSIMKERVQQKPPRQIRNLYEESEMREFSTIDSGFSRLNVSQWGIAQAVFEEHWILLRNIFTHYQAYNCDSQRRENILLEKISIKQFTLLLHDCKLLGFESQDGKISIGEIRKIGEDFEEGFTKKNFLHSLIDVADIIFPAGDVHEKLSKLLLEHLQPYACVSTLDTFRKDFYSMEVQQLFANQETRLRKCFELATIESDEKTETTPVNRVFQRLISQKITSENELEVFTEVNTKIVLLRRNEYDSMCETLGIEFDIFSYELFQELIFALALRIFPSYFMKPKKKLFLLIERFA